MSKIKVRQPVEHIPTFEVFVINRTELIRKLGDLHLTTPMGMLDYNYYYTNLEGWGKVLQNLVFNSSLYQRDKFDCENYALKAMSICAERYKLNAFGLVIGNTELGRHGFNIFYYGRGFLLWEPNHGFPFSGSAFEIGEYGYQPEIVLI